MPGRSYFGANGYRYGYQGQFAEKDEETGFNNFELRAWDGRLGRWMNPDPYRQYHSPYLGMGNNPVNMIDPDGGMDGDPPTFAVNGPTVDVSLSGASATISPINFTFVPGYTFGGEELPWRHPRPPKEEGLGSPNLGLYFIPLGATVKAGISLYNLTKQITPNGIPKNWTVKPSQKGGGKVFEDPKSDYNKVRLMPGNPNSPNPAQQSPYIKWLQNGNYRDVNGRVVPANSVDAHIPANSFQWFNVK